MTQAQLISALAKAIARQEGFYTGKGLAWDNNNPGNLRDFQITKDRWWLWPKHPHTTHGFPIFNTPSEGWAALEKDLLIKINRGMTLSQLIAAWAPAGPPDFNQPTAYTKNVVAWTGIPADKSLKSLIQEA